MTTILWILLEDDRDDCSGRLIRMYIVAGDRMSKMPSSPVSTIVLAIFGTVVRK